MSIWFHFLATRNLILRRKRKVLRMTIVAFVGTLWCVAGGFWTLSTYRDIQQQAHNVRVDVLINDLASDAEARAVSRRIASFGSVSNTHLMHEMEVWKEFTGEVGIAEDLRAVVSMPRIVRFTPRPEFATTKHLNKTIKNIQNSHASIIEEIVWQDEFVQVLDERRRDLLILSSIAGALSIVMFFLGLVYAFRAELHAAGGDLRVGSLLGASARWIAMPHMTVGAFAGLLGLTLACGVVFSASKLDMEFIPWSNIQSRDMLLIASALTVVGAIVAVWQSMQAARLAIRQVDL